MEKLMYRAVYCVVLVGMFWVVGCEDEQNHTRCYFGPVSVRSLQIVMADSTLEFLPGDSVSTSVIVIARDNNGLVVSNERVIVTLQNPLLGFLEFVDPARRDTTNEQGQVQFVFRSYGQYGDNAIIAQSWSVSTSLPFTTREGGDWPENLWVSFTPREICAHDATHPCDSTFVRVVITHQGGLPIRGVFCLLEYDVGDFLPDSIETDSNGVAAGYWRLCQQPAGNYSLRVRCGGLSGEDSIRVRDCP